MKRTGRKWRKGIILGGILLLVGCIVWIRMGAMPFGNSELKLGWVEHKNAQAWEARYMHFSGNRKGHLYSAEPLMHVSAKTEKGNLKIVIEDEQGGLLFSQTDIQSGEYDFEVPSRVQVSITAKGHKGSFDIRYRSPQIFLYGEAHAQKKILDRELELWGQYYHEKGMRHLFVEGAYYTAEFLNLWMTSENDDILDDVYADWKGTLGHNPEVKAFYKTIKKQYPETIFHGTDVGHQYESTGKRYLKYLEANGQEDSENYSLAQTAIEQGVRYYKTKDAVYRENTMTQNFISAFERLDGASIMGIYGTAHTNVEGMDYETQSVPCMANQLKTHFGVLLVSEDLTALSKTTDPLRFETLHVGGKDYKALYFGNEDIRTFSDTYISRDFWRLEAAYEDFKNQPTTGDVLPYNNYPMPVEEGQVFVIDYTKRDGSVKRMYYRSDGHLWQGLPSTQEFLIP